MKITYLSLIAGLSTGLAVSAPPVMAQGGQHHSGQQFHQQAQHQRQRDLQNGVMEQQRQREGERHRTLSNGVSEQERQRTGERERTLPNGTVQQQTQGVRERERTLPNGDVQQQRQQERTNAAGQTETRSQDRTIQPHP